MLNIHRQHMSQQITIMRLRDEIKFLYVKKNTINKELYNIHLRLVREGDKYWDVLQKSITESLNKTIVTVVLTVYI
jgi:hypothetical protein